ncbi:MAG: hypothetical protein IPL65_09345 [Lewinellaceae bacterium]|nr:hypothetical protein [Lewinellaceae bacterium]
MLKCFRNCVNAIFQPTTIANHEKVLLLLFLLSLTAPAFADQLAWLTKAQADKTQQWLNKNSLKKVVLWCACCDSDAKTKGTVQKYEIRQVDGYPEYYELVLTIRNEAGGIEVMPVDLAYVHIKKGKKARCLGKVIGLECDPCTKPFPW